MGITVGHEPSFLVTGQYAYRTARQQAANRVAAQQQVIDQKNADRQAEIVQNIQDNQAAIQKNRDDATAAFEKAKLDNEFKKSETQAKNEFTLQRDQALADQRQQQQIQTFHAQGVAVQEDQAKQVQKVLTSQNLSPEGKRMAGELMGKLRAIQKQRTMLPPDKYGQLMGQWLQEVDQSGIEAHEIKIPSVEESWQQDSKTLDDGTVVVREKNQNGEWTWKKIKDAPEKEKPANPAWGVEYNNVPEHQIPDDVYFRDSKKLNDAKKAAREKLEAEAERKMREYNASLPDDAEPKTRPDPVSEADVMREAIRARQEEKQILADLEAKRLEQEKKDKETLAALGAQGIPAIADLGGAAQAAADAVFGGGQRQPTQVEQTDDSLQAPAPVPAAPGKPATNPPEAAIPPGPAQDGSVTVQNKDGSTTTFATPEDAKKAAKEVGGVMGVLYDLAADEIKTQASPAAQAFDNMIQGVIGGAKKGKKKAEPKAEPKQEQPETGVFGKYASILPEGAGNKYREAVNDPKKQAEFENSPEGRMAINLHLYDSEEQFDADNKPLIKDLPKEEKDMKVGDIYYMIDPKDPEVTHDVMWDGKKLKRIASYPSKKQ